MEWIEAALAFAVVMMLLSTAVSLLMEAVYNTMRLREKGLRRLVESLYEDVIVPRLPRLDDDATATAFADQVATSRYVPFDKYTDSRLRRLIPWTVNAKDLKQISALEFVERFAETPAGGRLFTEAQRRGKDYLDTFLGDLASKFEDFSRSSSDYFARRAKLTSSIVAFFLAFALNIDAVHLYQTFLQDKEERQKWIDMGTEVGERALDADERARQALANINNTNVDQAALQASIDEALTEFNAIASSLKTSGLPVGWGSAPWNESTWSSKEAWGITASLGGWFLSVSLAGLLIGLGGPFWYDVFKKLGALAQMVRGVQSTDQQAKDPHEAKQVKAETFSAVFLEASRANALADGTGRALLAPDGTVDPGDRL